MPARLRSRANPVAVLVGCDLVASAAAAAVWAAMAPGADPVMAAAVLTAFVPVFAAAGAYGAPFPRPIRAALPAACLGLAPAMAGPFRPEHGPVGDALAPLFWLASLIVIAAGIGRVLLAGLCFRPGGGRFAMRVAVAGADGACARAVRERVDATGGRLLGYAAARPAPYDGGDDGGLAWLGEVDAVLAMARAGAVEEVVLGPGALCHLPAFACLPVAATLAVPVRGAVRLVTLCGPPLSDGQAVAKRVLDVVLAAAALVLLAPSMALVALAVRLDSDGPVLFRQQRAGFAGRSFALIKFRTMRADAADPDGARQTERDDARLTPVGRLLLRTSMDELPQLLNVLRGEMSLVGPRPHAWGSRAGRQRFEEVIGAYPARHRVRPGLTGLAQVRGHRGAIGDAAALRARTLSDLEYVRRWSLGRDLLILLRTAWVVLSMRNAA
ncbi:MAG TPA: sugar transferase [Acidisphaera sp.]|nr:sugar transferase [Acidisphaera sp.]